jgi:hypothetical protein
MGLFKCLFGSRLEKYLRESLPGNGDSARPGTGSDPVSSMKAASQNQNNGRD